MRKILFASMLILVCSLAAMAFTPVGHSKKAISQFKFNSEQLKKLCRESKSTLFKDFKFETQQDHFVKKGTKVFQSFDAVTNGTQCTIPVKANIQEGEQTVTLTVNLRYDKNEVFEVFNSRALSNNNGKVFWSEDSWEYTPEKLKFIVTPGNYDIEVFMETLATDYIVLTASEIEVNDDIEISLDVADATVEIKWNPLLPDGTAPISTYYVIDSTTNEIVDKISGNMLERANYLDIANKKHNCKGTTITYPVIWITDDSETETGLGNIRITPNKDYTFYYRTGAIGYDGGYIIPLMATAQHSATVTNDLSNYVTLEPQFAASRYKPEPLIYEDEGVKVVEEFNRNRINYMQFSTIIDGALSFHSGIGTSVQKGELKNCIHVCQDPKVIEEFAMLIEPTSVEDWDYDYSVTALPINIASESPFVLGINNTSIFSPYNALPDDSKTYMWEVNNPWLSFNINKSHLWNYGCPTLVFTSDSKEHYYTFAYIGRLGERRSVDLLSTIATVAIDDAIPSDEVMENLQEGYLPSKGKIDFEFMDTNVVIEDIEGKNTTRIGFDMSRADWCPPTLQIVRFVDIEDNFTDRYKKGEDGVIEFYGGDFTLHYNSETYASWYTEEPAAEVKVEYAPYGTESFLPLEVENIPERDFMPGFGTYYRGSLAGVDRKSENGWFDVRITLTDAAGNYQEQTLSPAFKIDENVGVETVVAPEIAVTVVNGQITVCGCENPDVEIYTPAGMLLKRYDGVSSIDASEFNNGVYLINVIDGSQRVVRKFRI